MYLKEIGKVRLLVAAEEVQLAKKVESGDMDANEVTASGRDIVLGTHTHNYTDNVSSPPGADIPKNTNPPT